MTRGRFSTDSWRQRGSLKTDYSGGVNTHPGSLQNERTNRLTKRHNKTYTAGAKPVTHQNGGVKTQQHRQARMHHVRAGQGTPTCQKCCGPQKGRRYANSQEWIRQGLQNPSASTTLLRHWESTYPKSTPRAALCPPAPQAPQRTPVHACSNLTHGHTVQSARMAVVKRRAGKPTGKYRCTRCQEVPNLSEYCQVQSASGPTAGAAVRAKKPESSTIPNLHHAERANPDKSV